MGSPGPLQSVQSTSTTERSRIVERERLERHISPDDLDPMLVRQSSPPPGSPAPIQSLEKLSTKPSRTVERESPEGYISPEEMDPAIVRQSSRIREKKRKLANDTDESRPKRMKAMKPLKDSLENAPTQKKVVPPKTQSQADSVPRLVVREEPDQQV